MFQKIAYQLFKYVKMTEWKKVRYTDYKFFFLSFYSAHDGLTKTYIPKIPRKRYINHYINKIYEPLSVKIRQTLIVIITDLANFHIFCSFLWNKALCKIFLKNVVPCPRNGHLKFWAFWVKKRCVKIANLRLYFSNIQHQRSNLYFLNSLW